MRRKNDISDSSASAEIAALRAPAIRRQLLAAYDAGKRTLPWRSETDPYRIWVSEVMLQQTRVDAVIPYYGRWLERFPDIETLAEAEEDEVLRVWQGLGYYSRARRLQEGARVVRETLGGIVPGSSEALRELPGVGEYTAGAVASIAFGEVVPAVDGNVKRVLSRLFDLASPTPFEYRALATALVDPRRPGDFNQAMMELGALVCVPRSPRCRECPVASECLALERGTVADRPAAKAKKRISEEDRAVLVAAAGDHTRGLHFLLRKRPATGLLAGMWEFPSVKVEAPGKPQPGLAEEDTSDAAWGLALEHGIQVGSRKPPQSADLTELPLVTHIFSHLKVRYRPFLLKVLSPNGSPSPSLKASSRDPSTVWISAADLDQVPIPVAQGKILKAALVALER
jgi:A/G-specific adenine glycosylase